MTLASTATCTLHRQAPEQRLRQLSNSVPI
jgi:hypothetical protein